MKKLIKVVASLVVALIAAYTAYGVPQIRDSVANILPLEVKLKIKNSLFIVSALKEEIAARTAEVQHYKTTSENHENKIQQLEEQKYFADLSVGTTQSWPLLAPIYSQSKNNLLLERAPQKTLIGSDGQEYLLDVFPMPFLPPALQHGYKPLFFVDATASSIYAITGEGVVFKTGRDELKQQQLKLETVPSNIRKVIVDKSFYDPSWFSIKDLKILSGFAYISYNKKVGANYTLGILRAELANDTLEFEEFFTVEDSVDTNGLFNAHQLGGRIVEYTDNKLLVSSGDMSKWEKAQDDNTLLGKIFTIDLDTKETSIVSKGHRNVQGLHFDQQSGVIFSTEHGPNGGDEINMNLNKADSNRNFGWPMASYGLHYDSRFHEEAPLHKSHAEHGYQEPLKNFTPSVGPSQIIKVPNTFKQGFSNDYFAATMGLNHAVPIQSLHHFRMSDDFEKIDYESIINVGERIRDIHILNDQQLLLALEGNGTPGFGLLRAKGLLRAQ